MGLGRSPEAGEVQLVIWLPKKDGEEMRERFRSGSAEVIFYDPEDAALEQQVAINNSMR